MISSVVRQASVVNLHRARTIQIFQKAMTVSSSSSSTEAPEHGNVGGNNNSNIKTNTATFAAGCFWGVELAFQRMAGVLNTQVGYTNGQLPEPTYRAVCSGTTGHAEAIEIQYNPSEISYDELLSKFWSIHDPTTLNRQKNDVGTQYRSGIYFHSDEQKQQALASKDAQQKKLSAQIVTEIEPAATFYRAEEYHQQYLEKGGQCAATGCTDRIRCYG